jgi:hypothetical protein
VIGRRIILFALLAGVLIGAWHGAHRPHDFTVKQDRSLSPGAGLRVTNDSYFFTAERPGSSDIPRVHPLVRNYSARTA